MERGYRLKVLLRKTLAQRAVPSLAEQDDGALAPLRALRRLTATCDRFAWRSYLGIRPPLKISLILTVLFKRI